MLPDNNRSRIGSSAEANMTSKINGGADMADNTKDPVADRRNFIKLAGATAAGAGATVATAGVATAATPVATDAQYRETTHVKQYYDTAR
jgi:hypothetical protein